MLQITKSIRIIVAGLACLWPLVFFTGLPAMASVSTTDNTVTEVLATTTIQPRRDALQGVFQRHEPSFFLDADPATLPVVALAGDLSNGAVVPQLAVTGSPLSLGGIALIAVLLLAAFNARKRRSRTGLAQG